MKTLKLALCSLFLICSSGFSQKYKIDNRAQEEKEHTYNTEDIGLADLIEMLKFQGIEINKFKLGKFDRRYIIYMLADEYLDGKMISTDTLLNTSNTYVYFESEEPLYHYIDQITIMSRDFPEEKKSQLMIKTYGFSTTRSIEMKNTEKENVLYWRKYLDTEWELNKKIPLLIYASSWLDKRYNVRRFCGVQYLKENDEDTNELLNSSPNYVKISYFVTE